MNEMDKVLGTWQMNVKAVRERMYGAPTAREREHWHAMWLMFRGMSAAQVADALERETHTIGDWLEYIARKRTDSTSVRTERWVPPPSHRHNKRL